MNVADLSSLLLPGEVVRYEGGQHRSVLIVFGVVGALLMPLWGFGVVVWILAWPIWKSLRVAVTDRRLLVRHNFPAAKVDDIPLTQVQAVQIEGNPTGKMATFTVTGSGGSSVKLMLLERPSEFHAAMALGRAPSS